MHRAYSRKSEGTVRPFRSGQTVFPLVLVSRVSRAHAVIRLRNRKRWQEIDYPVETRLIIYHTRNRVGTTDMHTIFFIKYQRTCYV